MYPALRSALAPSVLVIFANAQRGGFSVGPNQKFRSAELRGPLVPKRKLGG